MSGDISGGPTGQRDVEVCYWYPVGRSQRCRHVLNAKDCPQFGRAEGARPYYNWKVEGGNLKIKLLPQDISEG